MRGKEKRRRAEKKRKNKKKEYALGFGGLENGSEGSSWGFSSVSKYECTFIISFMNQKVILAMADDAGLVFMKHFVKESKIMVFQGVFNMIKIVPLLSVFNLVTVLKDLLRTKVSLSLPSSYFFCIYSIKLAFNMNKINFCLMLFSLFKL